ncbi:MAG TPA: hypothetical protein VNU72_01950 [Puia sp.]|jgi:hypothetical protein|nr:hypothetical protein [Puia sp.]
MKTIRFTAFLFYRYYSTGPLADIPYFSTLCAMVMLAGLHIFQILVLAGEVSLIPTKDSNTKAENYLIIAVCLVPLFLFMRALVPKASLLELNYEESSIRKGNIVLIAYIVGSVALLILLSLAKQGKL